MKLKGVKTLNKQMRKTFFHATGIDLPMKMDSDFYYFPNKQKIRYSIIISEKADRNFKNFVKNFFGLDLQTDVEIFCLSVLHEIGHFITYDNVAEGDYLFSKQEAEEISKILQKEPDNDEVYSRYFALPLEIIATTWAVNFIENHPYVFQKLTKEVQKNLNQFFEKNIDKN